MGGQRPGKRRAQVVMLALEPVRPHQLFRPAKGRLSSFGQPDEVGQVPITDTGSVARSLQVLQSVLPQQLMHLIPAMRRERDKRLVGQRA